MSAPPYMKFFWGDYFGDTRRLRTAAQHGAYLLLIGEMWRAGGSLSTDDAELAQAAMCTAKEWAALKPIIMPYFRVQRGKLTHKRVASEIGKYKSTSQKRKAAGKTGGLAKVGKDNGNTEAIAKQTPSKSPHNQNQNHKEEDAAADAGAKAVIIPASDWPDSRSAEALAQRVASPRLDPAKQPGLIQSAGCVARWRLAGAEWERDVVPVVSALCAKPGQPINSWSYFDNAVAEAVRANSRPLEIPDEPDLARRPGQTRRQAAIDEKLADINGAMEAALWERARERGGG